MQKIFQQEKRIYKLADIRLQGNIGGGGFGTVYKASFKSNPAVKQDIASKFIEKKKVMECQQVEHLLSQLNALKEIQNPFKIQYFGLGENKDYIFILTQLVSGTNLYQLTFDQNEAKRNLSPLEVKFIASQLLNVITDCHYHQYVYRDIKPQNIMINPSSKRIKLIDFGLSKKLAPGQRTYTFCGTPEYIAPQIINGSGHGYSVDWWSFGVLLYELSQGNAPFTSEKSPYQIYSKINVFSAQKTKISFSKSNSTLKGLILNLMEGDLSKRLGNNKMSVSKHQYFRGVRMNQLDKCESADSFKKIMMR